MFELGVKQIFQNPELPNGCEITSLCEVLNYYGINAEKTELADKYLPQSERWFGADPNFVYMGNPRIEKECPECGYYCFAGPVIAAADKYLAEKGCRQNFDLRDLTGSEPGVIYDYIKSGTPVIFWASLHFKDIKHDDVFFHLSDGSTHHVFHELHCMVACGVSDTEIKIADPLNFNEIVSKKDFEKVYRQLGSRAVAVVKIK